jgi:hypothetical protein
MAIVPQPATFLGKLRGYCTPLHRIVFQCSCHSNSPSNWGVSDVSPFSDTPRHHIKIYQVKVLKKCPIWNIYIIYIYYQGLGPQKVPLLGASRCLAPREKRVAASQKKERDKWPVITVEEFPMAAMVYLYMGYIYIYGTTMDNPSWGTCWVGLFHVIIYPATSSRMILKQYLWPNWWSLLESPRGMFFGDGQNHNSLVLLKLPENFLEKLRMVIIPNERKSMT